MNQPVIANLNGNERHKSLINETKNHRRGKAIKRDRSQKDTRPKFWKILPLSMYRTLDKTAVE